jgi:hypothetical protein
MARKSKKPYVTKRVSRKISKWNYRVVVEKDRTGEVSFAVYDAFYEDALKDPVPHSIGLNPVILIEDDREELYFMARRILKAFSKPMLCGRNLGGKHKFLSIYEADTV